MINRQTRITIRRGLRIGKYRIEALIAEGGFSQVWRVRDLLEQRSLALKIPNRFFPGSHEEEELLEEIRLGARLDHPNILRIKNAERVDGIIVIATDLAQESLEERLTRRMSTTLAHSFMQQLFEGLAYAHSHRIIHRDLKPSNLLIFPGNILKITDFGLAKKVRHSMISATGSGTLQYIAPEQAHGYPCFASDVFSSGLIAHQLMTGKLPKWPFQWPFAGFETLERKAPQELISIIQKATHPKHSARYRNAQELLFAYQKASPSIEKFNKQLSIHRSSLLRTDAKKVKELKFKGFLKRSQRSLHLYFECPECQGPISEHMSCCPWCGLNEISFSEHTDFPCYCDRCHHGLLDEWKYCPWCWGPGFEDASGRVSPNPRYDHTCQHCNNPLMQGMKYCPWCHTKQKGGTDVASLIECCQKCGGSVAQGYWENCPWCGSKLPQLHN